MMHVKKLRLVIYYEFRLAWEVMIKYVMLPKCYFKRLIWVVFNWKREAYEPNTHWNYSSGTTNLLSYILRNQFKTHQEYLDFGMLL
jgi:CubicO group peptidase (beta-lactamase class C family)